MTIKAVTFFALIVISFHTGFSQANATPLEILGSWRMNILVDPTTGNTTETRLTIEGTKVTVTSICNGTPSGRAELAAAVAAPATVTAQTLYVLTPARHTSSDGISSCTAVVTPARLVYQIEGDILRFWPEGSTSKAGGSLAIRIKE